MVVPWILSVVLPGGAWFSNPGSHAQRYRCVFDPVDGLVPKHVIS